MKEQLTPEQRAAADELQEIWEAELEERQMKQEVQER